MLRLGIIGLSPGNGHPYSWAAIFNGYDRDVMEHCGFPAIPRYLEQQRWPDATIADASVICVWTQDPALSRHIAKATRIATVLDDPSDMIGMVDAVLLARDDARLHHVMAEPFIKAGLPVYIDKPICLSLQELDRLYALERYRGQIFTCSAVRYSPDMQLAPAARKEIGVIREIQAVTPKDWERYAIHVIEPLLALVPQSGAIGSWHAQPRDDGGATLLVQWASGLRASIVATGTGTAAPIALRVLGNEGYRDLVFSDTFRAFKSALQDFVAGVRSCDVRASRTLVRNSVELIECGRRI